MSSQEMIKEWGRKAQGVWNIVWSNVGLPKQQGKTPGKGDSWSCIQEFLYSLDWERHNWVSSRSVM